MVLYRKNFKDFFQLISMIKYQSRFDDDFNNPSRH